jgi:hypothetical protein
MAKIYAHVRFQGILFTAKKSSSLAPMNLNLLLKTPQLHLGRFPVNKYQKKLAQKEMKKAS